MSDPRWDDVRDRDGQKLDDGRARMYDERDRDDHGPRDGLMHDLDLPRGHDRQLVVNRARTYELNGEDSRTLAAVGAFRVVPERRHRNQRRDAGPSPRRGAHPHRRAGRLQSGRRPHEGGPRPARCQPPSQTRATHRRSTRAWAAPAIDHDAHLYAAYREEETQLPPEHEHIEIRRIVLEQDLKREYQEFLQERNRDRPDSDGRPDRDEEEIRRWAQDRDLPYVDERVQFPDFRIEYEVDGRERHEDVELLAQHYRGAHAAGRASTGFPSAPRYRRRKRRPVQSASADRGGLPAMSDEHWSAIYDSARTVRVESVRRFEFTDRQARFLVTVMAHSGSFLERRSCACASIARGQNSREFVGRLVARGFATAITRGISVAVGSTTCTTGHSTKPSAR